MTPVRYAVRTPLLYWAVVGAVSVLCLVGAGLVAWTLTMGLSLWLGLAGLVLLAVPLIYLATTGEYRATGDIVLTAGEITVPGPQGRPLRFTTPGLRLDLTRVSVRVNLTAIPIADISRGFVIQLTDTTTEQKRRLSTLTLVDRDQQAALIADLERAARDEPPHGPAPRTDLPPRPQSELEAQLDRELAALD